MSPDELSERLLNFAARVGKVADALPDTRLGRHIAGQLIRCGTSPAPNYEEGCAAESRADFAHKLSLCLKELRESRMWLKLIIRSQLLPQKRVLPMFDESDQLCNIIGKSVVTVKKGKARSNDPCRAICIFQFSILNLQCSMSQAVADRPTGPAPTPARRGPH